jgi:two-component system response regulator WspF
MRHSPCPVLVVTATVPGHFDLVYKAMGAGAIDFVETPTIGPGGIPANAEPLVARLDRIDSEHRPTGSGQKQTIPHPAATLAPLVAIGVSTGGPDALAVVLTALPASFPAAVLVVQHIAAEYASGLVDALGPRCRLPIRSAANGDTPQAGTVYLAETEDHLELGPDLRLHYTPIPRNTPYRPSVDVLFGSLAQRTRSPGVGIILTGMGADGADGLLKLRQAGWHTIAQDEASSVVYGMPKAAIERQGACEVLPLHLIGAAVANQMRNRGRA